MILASGLPQQDKYNKEKLVNIWIIMILKIYTREAMYEEWNTDARSRNHCCRWKARCIIYSECFCSSGCPIWKAHAQYYTRIVLCDLSECTIFSYTISKTSRFSEKSYRKKHVPWFSVHLLLEIFLTLWRILWDMIIDVRRSSCKVSVIFLLHFKETWLRINRFSKNNQYQISWKSVPWKPSCSMQTDRHDEATNWFSLFCESAYKVILRKISIQGCW